MKISPKVGFSLVETVIALGIISFALVSILALFPVGMMSVHVSAQEMRATDILSILTTDLRNTGTPPAPSTAVTRSQFFGLQLPYAAGAAGHSVFSSSLTTVTPTTLVSALSSSGCSTEVNESEAPVLPGASSPASYQASIIYLYVPPAPTATSVSDAPIQARLIVNWPPLTSATATIADLTTLGKVTGYVEAFITYPLP